tara:strand:+ start:3930 stop:4139 length:210 start_codon:yes stop_codon:yes gene_type:complete
MPQGPGTYGSKVGRPSKKSKEYNPSNNTGGKIKPGPDTGDIDTMPNVKNPNSITRGTGAATQGIKHFKA